MNDDIDNNLLPIEDLDTKSTPAVSHLTEKQQLLFDMLPEARYDPVRAAKLAGYSRPYDAVRSLRKELAELSEGMLGNEVLKAVTFLASVITSEEPIPNLKERINVAQDILDRSGLIKKSVVDITHEVKGGVFLLPTKDAMTTDFIEGEYEDVP